jgi:hypothetical protein
MRNSSMAYEKWLVALTIVALFVSFIGATANSSENLRVPEDASLTVLEYAELGVPDPGKEWTAPRRA